MSYPIDDDLLEGSQIPGLSDIYMQNFGYITDGYFVEVGAFNGFNWSNTYCLAKIGWSGLLVEPHPEYFRMCCKRYAKNPRIGVSKCAIGDHHGHVDLYLGGSLSTIKSEMIDIFNNTPGMPSLSKDKSMSVAMITLDELLGGQGFPLEFELLAIDVEGAELDVLNGFSILHWQPKMCIIEANEGHPDKRLNFKGREINRYFKVSGYRRVYFDIMNSIYVR